MVKPSFEEFKSQARQGNLIPVYREVLADLDTPVSAYMKISQGEDSFLLESVEGGEKWARYCFLGCDPSTTLRIKARQVTLRTRDKVEEFTVTDPNPMSAVRDLLKKYQPVPNDDLPRFSGGAVGFISYDMVRYFEELPDTCNDDLNLPDAFFVITDTLLIFDNISQTIKIVSNAYTEGRDLEECYKETVEKIDALEKKLKGNCVDPVQKSAHSSLPTSQGFKSSFGKDKYEDAVRKIKNYILEGDAIQVVLAQRLEIPLTQDPFTIYRALRTINPSPYMYYLKFGDLQVVGSSPEILVRQVDDKIEVRPIAGTRPRGATEEQDRALEKELLADEKEMAEHIMLVDLGRNDLGRVAKTGTVVVNEKFTIERYSHVMHIVSNVQATMKPGNDCYDLLAATFPAGTVSGAPKVRAMEIIDELEPNRRGLYSGSVGYIGFSGNMDTAIAIRTLVVQGQTGYLGIGAGIVADSVPEKEYEETMNKGRALLSAIELAEKGLIL